jgi:dihydrofolate reductase
MPELIFHAFLAITPDGFIARSDGSIDFLNEANKAMPESEDCGIAAFLSSVDAIVMGRKTYMQVLEFKQQGKG